MEEDLRRLKEIGKEIILLDHIKAILTWDQETYMPPNSIEERSEQISFLEGLFHEKIINPEIGDLLSKLGVTQDNPEGRFDLEPIDRAYLREFYRDHTRNIKLPERLVVELAKESSVAQSVWVKARQNRDFKMFVPHLNKLVMLNREKAERLGYMDHPYDALLDEFEPWMKTERVTEVFSGLQKGLKEIIEKIKEVPQVDDGFLLRDFPVERQKEFGTMVLKEMGFDFDRGRLDVSAHPFTTTLGSDDVRLTSRYNKNFFKTGIFGIIHEGGHGLYELGFLKKIKGNILAMTASLGIHESQSRIWENMIGRSHAFWQYYYPKLKDFFPESLGDISLNDFYRGINKVEPSHIRVEADEVTYSLHIILRFTLETEIISGNLAVKDLPDAWNSKSEELLGIIPGDDSEGVLQDIHWSMGAIGYFPTYALGNLYGAQFYSALKGAQPELEKMLACGDFSGVLNWLRENIHCHGRIYKAEELVKRVTGEELNPDYFIKYLKEKYSEVYGLSGF
ncbi:MAG: carboxypeptidase M32 [Spirochaetes bacterium]|nr:MAG: carboxypeptidase M32 [Spirochaetota bacterium]